MFNLDTDQMPSTTAGLTDAITASLRRRIDLPGGTPVVLTGDLPTLDSMALDVSGGAIDTTQTPPDLKIPAETQDGPGAELFTIKGHPILVEGIPLQFELSAKNVVFAYARKPSGELIAALRDAADGHLSVQLQHDHLEEGILAISKKMAASSGVSIQKVSATLTSIDSSTVDVLLHIIAKKFVTATLRISGRLSVDDQMIARATNLKADGEGVVANIAVGFIRPQLQKLNNQPLPLLAFSLGNVKLHGVKVQTTDGVRIAADFGSVVA